jgi:hypothetical protein
MKVNDLSTVSNKKGVRGGYYSCCERASSWPASSRFSIRGDRRQRPLIAGLVLVGSPCSLVAAMALLLFQLHQSSSIGFDR